MEGGKYGFIQAATVSRIEMLRGNNWTDAETFALLDQWADEKV